MHYNQPVHLQTKTMTHKLDRANSMLAYSVLGFLAACIMPMNSESRTVLSLASVGLYVRSESLVNQTKRNTQRQTFESAMTNRYAPLSPKLNVVHLGKNVVDREASNR